MRDVFAAMPDSMLPMVTKNNRLDCIDFIENAMEARVRNVLGDYVTLEALTADYARFRTSASAVMEMKLLPLKGDSSSVLCVVTTAQAGEEGTALRMEDSNLRFLRPDWSVPDTVPVFSMPDVEAFMKPEKSDSIDADYDQALRSLRAFHPVRYTLSPDDDSLTVTLQTAALSIDERKAVLPRLQPLRYRWNGLGF